MTTKFYQINGVWNTYQYWHDNYGYTTEPTQSMNFKSSASGTWGTDVNPGYFTSPGGYTIDNWSFWSQGIVGWKDIDQLALAGAYPATAIDVLLERSGQIANAVYLDDSDELYYLIDGYLSDGWRTWDEVEADGWQIYEGLPPYYMVVNETTGSVEYYISGSEMITVYETGVPVESFYFTSNGRNETENTILEPDNNYTLYDENGNVIDDADIIALYENMPPDAFTKVDGNMFVANENDILFDNDGELCLLTGDSAQTRSAWSVQIERIEPAPPAPTELTAYFTNQGSASTDNTRIGGDFGSTPAPLYDASGNTLPFDLTKKYTINGVYNYSGELQDLTYARIIDTMGNLQLLPGSSRRVYRIELTLSPQTTFEAYFTTNGSSETNNTYCGNSTTKTLYDASGNTIPYDSTKTYTTVASFVVNGDTAYTDFTGNFAGWSDTVLKGRAPGSNYYYKLVIRIE